MADLCRHYVDLFASFIPNFWFAVAAAVVGAFILLIPLKICAKINTRRKAKASPQLKEINKKYGINPLGGSNIDPKDETIPLEIRQMTANERETKAAEEMEAVYKQVKYRPFTEWIPRITELFFIVVLYAGIRGACPEGVGMYTETVKSGNWCHDVRMVVLYYAIVTAIRAGHEIFTGLKKKNKDKTDYILAFVPAILSIGFCVLLSFTASPAVLVGIATLSVCESILTIVSKLTSQKKEEPI